MGRQLDGVPATIEVVSAIADALGGRTTLLVDGGIRRGTDVLKAVALGARRSDVRLSEPLDTGAIAYTHRAVCLSRPTTLPTSVCAASTHRPAPSTTSTATTNTDTTGTETVPALTSTTPGADPRRLHAQLGEARQRPRHQVTHRSTARHRQAEVRHAPEGECRPRCVPPRRRPSICRGVIAQCRPLRSHRAWRGDHPRYQSGARLGARVARSPAR